MSRPAKGPSAPHKLLDQALRAAQIGDRWFVGLARGLGALGGLSNRRASSGAGAATERASDEDCEDMDAACSELRHPSRSVSSPPSGTRVTERPANTLELLAGCPVAAPCEPRARKRKGAGTKRKVKEPPSGDNPPGVFPLVEALGRVVEEHTAERFVTLSDDPRLWTLVDLLHALAPAGELGRSHPANGTTGPDRSGADDIERLTSAQQTPLEDGRPPKSGAKHAARADTGPRKERRCTRFGS